MLPDHSARFVHLDYEGRPLAGPLRLTPPYGGGGGCEGDAIGVYAGCGRAKQQQSRLGPALPANLDASRKGVKLIDWEILPFQFGVKP